MMQRNLLHRVRLDESGLVQSTNRVRVSVRAAGDEEAMRDLLNMPELETFEEQQDFEKVDTFYETIMCQFITMNHREEDDDDEWHQGGSDSGHSDDMHENQEEEGDYYDENNDINQSEFVDGY